ncbi:enamine deaminase RidA (YjgF/YER057c/UK114 family) [Kibdelosporangium banguiense]|uniref:Enamine deaminase RidA (YjgF/YER057c/UK114 family) n=1 Tax=Kibdelosporangium banguiense TaxID=1365924 RepID=A0ABS4TU19_9PSEU|nr:RidA family protein [Kibdelosporangium banguiense]MBP2327884.1 enamine deaminase RidA (YjgF/YER057c/UK114 family) [Kibdelosporangium banguiense]
MPKHEVVSPDLAVPNGHFAQATVVPARGRLLFVSGMTARNATGDVTGVGDITAQTHQVCQNLAAAVKAAGGTLDDIARVDVYVRNMEDFAAIHSVRRQYFTGVAPASTMVEVSKFVNKDYLIEINAIAVLPDEDER